MYFFEVGFGWNRSDLAGTREWRMTNGKDNLFSATDALLARFPFCPFGSATPCWEIYSTSVKWITIRRCRYLNGGHTSGKDESAQLAEQALGIPANCGAQGADLDVIWVAGLIFPPWRDKRAVPTEEIRLLTLAAARWAIFDSSFARKYARFSNPLAGCAESCHLVNRTKTGAAVGVKLADKGVAYVARAIEHFVDRA